MKYPKVFIIILNWNGYKDTSECLHSLKRLSYPVYEVVVVDNGSTDGSVLRLKKDFKDAVYIENKENLGFAEGNNIGIQYAIKHGAEYVLLLNNDTLVESNLLDVLISEADSDELIGVVGPKIYSGIPDSVILWGAGGVVDWVYGKTYHIGYNERDAGQWDKTADVDYVSGCAMLIKRKVLDDIGLLDNRYYLYYEETDFCMRVKKSGFRIVYTPDAKLWHKVSNTTGGAYRPVYTYYMTRNRLLFMRAYSDNACWRRFLFYFIYDGILRRAVVLLLKSNAPVISLKALWMGWIDFRHNRFYKGPDWLHQV